MMFNSKEFFVFFTLVLLFLFITTRLKWINNSKTLFLLLISLIFYGVLNIKCLLLLLFVISYSYYFGLNVKEKKVCLYFEIVISVLILFVFKYYSFFVNSFADLFNINNTKTLYIIMPVGISFYTFKSISYVVDVYRDKCSIEKNYLKLALYISFFPEIVAGPISKPKKLLTQFNGNFTFDEKSFFNGLQIFFIGLFKKIVIADNISVFVNEIYRAPTIYSSISIWLCVIAYSFEIYMDFSGYSDMAIGCSKMLGIDIEKNFNLPYLSFNVTEFWKRWHMTLSSWLMEYVYIPLGGNRKGRRRQFINLLITMIVGGLWHGANWTFVLWGALNGLALVIHKLFLCACRTKEKHNVISMLLTFFFISMTWVLFRADSINNAFDIYRRLFVINDGIIYLGTWGIIGVVFGAMTHFVEYINNKGDSYYMIQDLTTIKGLTIFFVFVGLTIGLAYTGFNPFIYAAF